jgi:hypothetical protein
MDGVQLTFLVSPVSTLARYSNTNPLKASVLFPFSISSRALSSVRKIQSITQPKNMEMFINLGAVLAVIWVSIQTALFVSRAILSVMLKAMNEAAAIDKARTSVAFNPKNRLRHEIESPVQSVRRCR